MAAVHRRRQRRRCSQTRTSGISRRLGLLVALAACSGGGNGGDAADDDVPIARRYGGTVTIGANADVSDISPLTFRVQNALYLQQFVLFLPLIAYDEQLEPVPRLAHSWEVAPDTTTLTFRLREDVYWHDGVLTTAHDVDLTYRLARDPRTTYVYAGLLSYYRESEVVDSFTWRVALEPHSGFMDIWRVLAPVPRHVLADVPPERLALHPFSTRSPVGNGPFRFVERVPSERWVFEANPDFPSALGGRPYLDRVVYRVIPEHSARLTELFTGGIDLYQRLPVDYVPNVERNARTRLLSAHDRSWTHLVWNHRRAPFGDVRVRRALTHAIDRQALLRHAARGHGSIAHSTVAPVFPQHDSTAGADLTYDPLRATTLLAEAGYRDRDGDGTVESDAGSPLRFTIRVPAGYPERRAAGEVIQADLRKLGVDAQLQIVEFNVLLAEAGDPARRNFDAMILAWSPEFRIDDSDLFGCDRRDGPVAFTGYCNPATDALLDSIARAANPVAAGPLWSRYQHHIAAEQPVTFLFHLNLLHAASSRLRDAAADSRGDWYGIERWWIPPALRR